MSNRLGIILADGLGKFKSYLHSAYAQLNDYDVEDVIQQTALNLLVREDSDNVYNATAYIYAALRNGALSLMRKQNKEVPDQAMDEVVSSKTADDAVLTADLKQQIKSALCQLDEKSRYVFVQTELAGKSYKQLSEQTGEPIGTLLSRKSRAVKKLAALLDHYYYL